MTKERPAIFISYRRSDSGDFAGRLADRLKQRFGKKRVFLDVGGGIGMGVDFTKAIEDAVGKCHVLIAVIGKDWTRTIDERRDQNDWVRVEIAAALNRGVHVIPIRIEDAEMPRKDELPEVLHSLPKMNGPAFALEHFDAHAKSLIESLEAILREKGARIPAPTETRRAATIGSVVAVGLLALAYFVPWDSMAGTVGLPPCVVVLKSVDCNGTDIQLRFGDVTIRSSKVEIHPSKQKVGAVIFIHDEHKDRFSTDSDWRKELKEYWKEHEDEIDFVGRLPLAFEILIGDVDMPEILGTKPDKYHLLFVPSDSLKDIGQTKYSAFCVSDGKEEPIETLFVVQQP